jgi:Xaa-Pro aminopeptidase
VSVEVFDELVKFIKPGVSFREVVSYYRKLVIESGHTPKGMLLHGRGIGEDRPQITGEVSGDTYNTPTYTKHLDLPVLQGNVFVLKPGAMPSDEPDSIRCGDTVVITADGARRLGKRQFSFPNLM